MDPAGDIRWFAARTRNGQWKRISTRLRELGVEHYIPESYHTLLFLHTAKPAALSLVNSGEIGARFLIDHGTRTLLEVPPKQMEDFIRIMDLSPDAECLTDVPLTKGDRVTVAKGPFRGVEGEILETDGTLYLYVRVMSLLCAKIRIPRSHVIPVQTTSSSEKFAKTKKK